MCDVRLLLEGPLKRLLGPRYRVSGQTLSSGRWGQPVWVDLTTEGTWFFLSSAEAQAQELDSKNGWGRLVAYRVVAL